jgi:hypothetical protein
MQLTRSFTKVYTKPRKPLSVRLDAVEHLLEAVEQVVVSDVRFALTGEETPTANGLGQIKKKDKITC